MTSRTHCAARIPVPIAHSLPEDAGDVAHAGISPAPDGDNPQHPVHDEDLEDAGPEDFE
jgi:hypothetical protein